jgi:cell division protein ZapE
MQPMPDYSLSVSEQLKSLTASGALQIDSAQMHVAKCLDRVLSELKRKRPAAKASALGWLFAAKKKPSEKIKGLYIHGSVGRGKTMLMDMFFGMAPCARKRRAHFHEFMADVHNRIAAHRLKLKQGETKQADPIPVVAAALYDEAELLCFDEFTVTDIADAMILSRLFSDLFRRGCILIATSNVEPENLYRDGLNRSLFLPFVDLLQQNVDVVTLDSPTDYRLEKLDSQPVYLTPLNDHADMAMDASWMQALHGRKPQPIQIPMKGRHDPCSARRRPHCTLHLCGPLRQTAWSCGLSCDLRAFRCHLSRSRASAGAGEAEPDQAVHHSRRYSLQSRGATLCVGGGHAGELIDTSAWYRGFRIRSDGLAVV